MKRFMIEHLEPRRCIGQRRRVRPAEIGAALTEMLPETFDYLGERGLVATSPPMLLYLDHDTAAGTFLVQAGFFVEDAEPPEPPFRLTSVPGGDVARTLHRGPYTHLGETHDALRAWIRAQGRTPAAYCWEVYVDDPSEVDPPHLRTEIWYGLKPLDRA